VAVASEDDDPRRRRAKEWQSAEHDAVTKVGPMPMPDAPTARLERPAGPTEEDTALVALPDEQPKKPPVQFQILPAPEESSRSVGVGTIVVAVTGAIVAVVALVVLLGGGDDENERGVQAAIETSAPAEETTAVEPAPRPPPPPATAAGADELVRAGNEALLQGLGDRAEGYYLAATRADADSAPAWRGLGASRELRADRPGALAAYRRYLELAPDAPDAMTTLTRIEQLAPPPPPPARPVRRRRRR
jgi:hypothetical protein